MTDIFFSLVSNNNFLSIANMNIKGTYFNCIMFMVASSVVLTVVVLNYHHRTADIHEMPQWVNMPTNNFMPQSSVKKGAFHWSLPFSSPAWFAFQIKSVFLQWLPWILRMGRPGKKITRKTIMLTNRMKELELKERSSKSLLANVLDIDDDFRHVSGMTGSTTQIGSTA